jgi:quinolinate synthase
LSKKNNLNSNQLSLVTKGFVDAPIPAGINLVDEIIRLKKEKNAALLAHYYQEDAIQDLADFLGDSLYLAKAAAEVDSDIIVFAGVDFISLGYLTHSAPIIDLSLQSRD